MNKVFIERRRGLREVRKFPRRILSLYDPMFEPFPGKLIMKYGLVYSNKAIGLLTFSININFRGNWFKFIIALNCSWEMDWPIFQCISNELIRIQ